MAARMHFKPRHRLRPLSSLLLSFALGCSGSAPEQDSSEAPASQAQRLSPSSKHALPPGLAPSRVKDIQVGIDTRIESQRRSSYSGQPRTASLGSTFYFTAFEESTGEELWQTDGTREGTRLARELIPGLNDRSISGLATVGDTLFVSTNAATPSAALWKSDGTPEGTVPWALGENCKSPGNPIACNGALFFQDFNPTSGFWRGLWKSDGSPEGTVQLSSREWFLGFDPASRFACANGMLFFVAYSFFGGEELWRSDGTAEGTVFLGTLGSLQVPWDGTPFIVAAGSHVFISGSFSGGLWTSDGTPEGTTLLGSGGRGDTLFSAESPTAVGERLFFIAMDAQYRPGLWTSDGTAAGTQRLTQLQWGPTPGLVAMGDTLLFSAGNTLSRSNGTPEGTTVLLEDLGLTLMPREGARLPDGRWLIVARRGIGSRFALWVTDGTSAGTTPLQLDGGLSLAQIPSLRRHGDHVVFWADDGLHGTEPWVTDGTPAGTRMLRDIFRGDSSNPQSLLDMGGTLFFTAYDSEHGRELWKSDGTAEGTTLVVDLAPGPTPAFQPPYISAPSYTERGPLYAIDGTLYFTANDGAHGTALWKSDGTSEGTVLLHDHTPGARGSALWNVPIVAVGPHDTFAFPAPEPMGGLELWMSDGTPEGTRPFHDIALGGRGSTPSQLTVSGSRLFFVADEGEHGRELWSVKHAAFQQRP